MMVPMSWLKDYVDIDVDVFRFADAMTLSGSKIENIHQLGKEIINVVTGKIVSIENHPNANKLRVCKVDVGNKIIQVVTGASNVKQGDCVPVAIDGAKLPGGVEIVKSKLRGVMSEGMMCSVKELALDTDLFTDADKEGIYILAPDTLLGVDIRKILALDDTCIEFEITPNRPDCLSVIGIAREAAATFNKQLKYPGINVKESDGNDISDYINIEIKQPDLCKRYAARVIKDVKITESPDWMRKRLINAGIRPINNIVDVTNYVMFEIGQPLHAFDIEQIKGNKIIVRNAYKNEIITTLDEKQRKLESSMLVIADKDKPIAVAGIFGGIHSGIKQETKTILIESANFNGTSVRATSDKLGIRTEASTRFEKGLDANLVTIALDRAAQLLNAICAGCSVKGVVDCYPHKSVPITIDFAPEKINKLLGTNVSENEMIKILDRIELKVDKRKNKVLIPTFRNDIEGTADLAEEVARFYGYNNIAPTLLDGCSSTIGKKTYTQKIEDIITDTMLHCGLFETYTFSITTPKAFDKIRLSKDAKQRNAVAILNPLSDEQNIMRTSTIPDMLTSLVNNYNKSVKQAKLFELSYIYIPNSLPIQELPIEKRMLTIGMYGDVDFYDIKGVVESLLVRLGIRGKYEFIKSYDNPTFHSGRTASIIINGAEAGIIGEIHPEVAHNYGIDERVYFGAIDVQELFKAACITSKYKALPKFPPADRDIAFIVNEQITAKQLEGVIKQVAGDVLEEITLFDIYKGKQIPNGYKSVAYSLRFRAFDRTLTDETVNKIMQNIMDELAAKTGAELRV